MRWFVSRSRAARVRPKAQRNLRGQLRPAAHEVARPRRGGSDRTSQSVWAMAWAEAGAPSKNSTSPKKSPGPRMVERLLPDARDDLADAHRPWWMTWSWPARRALGRG